MSGHAQFLPELISRFTFSLNPDVSTPTISEIYFLLKSELAPFLQQIQRITLSEVLHCKNSELPNEF